MHTNAKVERMEIYFEIRDDRDDDDDAAEVKNEKSANGNVVETVMINLILWRNNMEKYT